MSTSHRFSPGSMSPACLRAMAGVMCSKQIPSWCRHALVIDCTSGPPGRQLHMHPLPVELKEAEIAFLGPMRDPGVAAGIAAGRLQPQPPYAPFPARLLAPQQTGSPWQHSGHALSQSQRAPAPVKSSWMRPAHDLLAGAAARPSRSAAACQASNLQLVHGRC